MKNVLSIDLDVMFECEKYSKYMIHDIDHKKAWQVVDIVKQEKNFSTDINEKVYKKICEVLVKFPSAKFRIIQEHDEIIDVMKFYNVKDAAVYNMDFHHDVSYNNDDVELNIENWVKHGKNTGIIKEYHWLSRTMSEALQNPPFEYFRTNIEDLVVNKIECVDLVVICVSKHFTPYDYHNSLSNVLLSYRDIGGWQEVNPGAIDLEKLNEYDTYTIDGTSPDIKRIFRQGNSYIVLEDKNISMISFDNKMNIFSCKHVVDMLLSEYKELQIDYLVGIPNEKYIKRLIKNYEVISELEVYGIKQIKIKEVNHEQQL